MGSCLVLASPRGLSKEEEQRLHDEDEQDYAKYSNDDDNNEDDWDDNGYCDDEVIRFSIRRPMIVRLLRSV